jgi:HSP20 family molecular chaperone IbpA
MSTKILVALFIGLISIVTSGWAVVPSDPEQNQEAINKAKQDYRVFLGKLKELNSQYKNVTKQMSEVIKEEGVPTWDNNTNSLAFTKDISGFSTAEGVRIQQDDKEMNVSIDLPGLKKNSIKASIEDVQVLKISATRTIGQETLPIEKAIKLPAPAKGEGTQAKYEDGVLTVKIPKLVKKEIPVPIN